MKLTKNSTPASISYHGSGDFSARHGKYLKIETTPNGQEILTQHIPNDEDWRVTINIDVIATKR